ncbi:molybdenum ABC transporter ATP-binding protein [Ideonella sp. DXS22W]|uniref:Molybdenum ABC transporter ATP-binding protein n=1 Tax=Pseudaquabacterium inlustre TaxID=2984192 RepID=A0ABU9CH05_9BURK
MIEARLRLPRRDFTLDVDLTLPGQGVSVLFGPSGCGKTTVLRALAGLERAAGRVVVDGQVWQDDAAGVFVPTHRRPLGYVIQEAALFPHLDVAANLAYGRQRSGADAQRIALDSVVDLLGIGPLMARRPATLSGGERQRVAIARALATGPRLLLMDEPLAALDAQRKAEILPYLERLHRELALPVVLVTHAMDEAARLAHHLVLLAQGRVLAAGPVAELLARPDLPLARQDEAGVVIDAAVAEHDARYGLTRIGFAGGGLWLGESAVPVGQRVRARVLARDVSVARQPPQESSVLNVLPVVLESLHADRSTALLRLAVRADLADAGDAAPPGEAPVHLLARITRRSLETLALQPGEALYAQVKGAALM